MAKTKKPARPLSKKGQVLAMIESAPTSVAMIEKALAVSKPAAYSLIGDLKRDGVAITGALHEGAMHYTLAAQPLKPKAAKRRFGRKVVEQEATPTA
jgi:hypothetical protein